MELNLEPFDIQPTLDDPEGKDAVTLSIVANNARIVSGLSPGTRVRYRGPMGRLKGKVGVVRADPRPSARNGVTVDFSVDDLAEFGTISVFDLNDLLVLR